jgi:hypothetical protein
MTQAATEVVAQHATVVVYLGAILIPPAYLHFVLSLLLEERRYLILLIAAYGVAVVELYLFFSGGLLNGVSPYQYVGFYETPGEFYLVYVASFVALPIIAFAKLLDSFRRTDAVVKRNQLKYVIYSTVIGFVAGSMSFTPFFTSQVPPFGAPLVYLYTLPITYAVAQYRLMDISVVIKRSVIYAALLVGLLIPCFLVVIWGQHLAFEAVNVNFSVAILLLFITVGFFFPKVRFRTEDALERVLFKKGFDYRETLLRSSQDMVAIVDLKALSDKLVETIGKSLRIDKVSLLLSNEGKGSYNLEASVGLDFEHPERILLSREGPLIKLLQSRKEPIVKEELEWVPVGPETPQTIETMGKLGAEISLPIISKEKLIGILNLGHKEDKSLYSDEDLELLSTLGNQAAIAIENARLYENLKQSQVTLRRADRLSGGVDVVPCERT